MKKYLLLFSLLIVVFLGFVINIVAADEKREAYKSRIQEAYNLYNKNPAESCLQLDDVLQSPDVSTLTAKELKDAYYFSGNCNYQLRNLEKAAQYYQKVAELSPEDHQSLLDAGSVYVEQGWYAQAEKKYREALQRIEGDELKEKKVRSMIENMPSKLRTNFTFSTSVGYDDNVNSGPEDTIHFLYGVFNYTLESDEKPREDGYYYNSLYAALSKAIKPNTYLLLNLGANYKSYFSEKDFNTSVLSASMGYKKVFGSKSVTVTPYVNYQTFDDRSYQLSTGMNVSGAIYVSEKINFWPHLGWYSQNFYNEKDRDGHGVSVGGSASYKLNEKTSLMGSLFFTHNNARQNQYTYNNFFIGATLYRNLTDDLKAILGYTVQLFNYDDIDPAFGSSREDTGHQFYFGLEYSLRKLFKKNNTRVKFDVTYNDNNSNHSFQERNRLFVALQLIFSF